MAANLTEIIGLFPKPSTLQFSYPKDWGAEETGLFGALADGSVAGALKSAGLDIAQGITSNQAQAAAQAKYGKSINKRNKAIFRDLPFRQVSFAWTLRPRSKEKSVAFAAAIEILRRESAPKLVHDGSLWDTNHAIWELEIKTKVREAPADIIFKSSSLVITELAVDYTPNGFWSQHKDGYPTQIGLSISLMEIELAHYDKLAQKAMV